MEHLAKRAGVWLSPEPVVVLPKELLHEASRRYDKGVISYQNLYGYSTHKNSHREQVAGVHLSITRPIEVREDSNRTHIIFQNFDWVQLFRYLDKAFTSEIKDSKRRPGFYEVKYGGRVEYRSLPTNVDLHRLIEEVESFMQSK